MGGPEFEGHTSQKPSVAARHGSQPLDAALDTLRLLTMGRVSNFVSSCSKASTIIFAQNLCSMVIFAISATKSSLIMVDSVSLPNGRGARVGRTMRAISLVATSHSVSFTISAWRGILGQKILRISLLFWMVKRKPTSLPLILIMVGVIPSSSMLPMMPSSLPSMLTMGVGL
jgi:hypothetical protein